HLPCYDTLFHSGWENRVAEVLPLLRRLRRVRFAVWEAENNRPALDLTVQENSQRMSFLAGGRDDLQPGSVELTGGIAVRTANENQVRVQPAVFLPLGEPETHAIGGEWSYGIFLHGHFFVDSGRRDIELFDKLPDETTFATAKSEEEIRKLWNRTLMGEVVAP